MFDPGGVNLLLLQPEEVDEAGRARLEDPRRVDHLRRVLGVAIDDVLRAGIVDGPVGRARVAALDPAGVTLIFEPGSPSPVRPPVDLVLALPRPKVLRRVLRAAAELGVGRLDLVNAWRVDKSYWGSPRLRPEAMRAALCEGCEQAGQTWLPRVAQHRLLVPFVDQVLPRRSAGLRVLAHPAAERGLETLPGVGERRVLVALGPEGGWTDTEVDSFVARDFVPVTFGKAILRTEVAVALVLGQLQLLRRLDRASG
jgi:RsmE family RNA methyltransferase